MDFWAYSCEQWQQAGRGHWYATGAETAVYSCSAGTVDDADLTDDADSDCGWSSEGACSSFAAQEQQENVPENVLACVEYVLIPRAERLGSCAAETWTCPSCGNINYKYRMVCNLRRCRRVRPQTQVPDNAWVCSSCGNVNFAGRSSCNMRKCRAPRHGWGVAETTPERSA